MRRPSTSVRLKLGYVAVAAVDTWLARSPATAARHARKVTKPLLMPLLAASLATSQKAVGSPLRTSTLVAQGFSWGGDVALLGRSETAFLAGTGSFGVSHAAYVLGFHRHRRRGSRIVDEPVPRLVTGVWALSAPVVAIAAGRKDPKLGAAVAVYSAILAKMVATASRLDRSIPAGARGLALTGAGLFLVSDTLLGLRMFVLSNPPKALEGWVMGTYTGAQLLLSEAAERA